MLVLGSFEEIWKQFDRMVHFSSDLLNGHEFADVSLEKFNDVQWGLNREELSERIKLLIEQALRALEFESQLKTFQIRIFWWVKI